MMAFAIYLSQVWAASDGVVPKEPHPKDFMNQVSQLLAITPIKLPTETQVINAYEHIRKLLPASLVDTFKLIAVCIGEHVLTKELISIGKEKSVNKSFAEVMADHVLDEGRHAGIFKEILTLFWSSLDDQIKTTIGTLLPVFLQEYLKTDIQKEFDRHLLQNMDFSVEEVDKIINDTYIQSCSSGVTLENPVAANLVKMLERCKVLDHVKTRAAFAAFHLQ
jgi:hypothetical protein